MSEKEKELQKNLTEVAQVSKQVCEIFNGKSI